jgi:TIR domain
VPDDRPGYLVFISHSSKDRWIARQMAAIIERKAKRYGVRTFLDEVDLEGGDRIPATIKANLLACEEFVILLSPQSVTRQWVLVELGEHGHWTSA